MTAVWMAWSQRLQKEAHYSETLMIIDTVGDMFKTARS